MLPCQNVPTGDVRVDLSSDQSAIADVDWGLGNAFLTFTVNNWDQAQGVSIVAGVDDSTLQDLSTLLTVSASNGGYDTVSDQVTVNVTNATAPSVTISTASIEMNEGDQDSFTLVLDAQPTDAVTLTLTSSDSAAVSGSPTSFSFTTANWNVAQTVTVEALQDTDGTDENVFISLSAGGVDNGGYAGVSIPDVFVEVEDDDSGGLGFTDPVGIDLPSSESEDCLASSETTSTGISDILTIEEGGSGCFAFALTSAPSSDSVVVVTVASRDASLAQVSSLDQADPVGALELVFTADNWDEAQSVKVTGVEQASLFDQATVIDISTAEGESDTDKVTAEKNVLITNTTQGTVGVSKASLSVGEAGHGSFLVVLEAEPTAAVTLDVVSENPEAAVVSPAVLEFTPTNWSTAQQVTVSGVIDTNTNDEVFNVSVTPRADQITGYETTGSSFVEISLVDEAFALILDVASLKIEEGGEGELWR